MTNVPLAILSILAAGVAILVFGTFIIGAFIALASVLFSKVKDGDKL